MPAPTPFKSSDVPIENRLFAMFVGRYDTGKTTAACTFPGNINMLEMDGRFKSIRNKPNLTIYPFRAKDGFGPMDELLTKWVTYSQMKQPIGDVVILDSLSMLRRMLLRDAVKLTGGVGKDGKVSGRKIGHLQMPTVQDYGYEYEAVWQIVYDGLKQLPCTIIVTAHVVPAYKVVTTGGISERVEIGERILATPQLVAQLPIMFDEIYYFSKEVDPQTNSVRRFVEFDGDVARTSYDELREVRKIEITGKDFYTVWHNLVNPSTTDGNSK